MEETGEIAQSEDSATEQVASVAVSAVSRYMDRAVSTRGSESLSNVPVCSSQTVGSGAGSCYNQFSVSRRYGGLQ